MSQGSLFAIGAFVFAITVFATLFYGYVVFTRGYGAGLPKGQVFPGFQGTLREEGSPAVRPQAAQTINENTAGA
jgi:hypothetical protein